ncbi:MAG TPA: serine/threonine-protein kinase [Nocardioides sp.]|nr:serine/threonine-protein kinase [Nocardioides sp.]
MATDGVELVAGRYRLGEVIGSGGMAEVHRAYDELLCRDVAIKLMRPTLTSEVDRQRFAAEMRLLAGLNDPGLVMLLDAGVEQSPGGLSRSWLALELVDGPTLAQRIAEGTLDPREVASIGAALAGALAHVHAAGIVHRDVKPANVLLTPHGSPKLADFGIARLAGEQAGLTSTGHTIGTAAYLAPEQVRGLAVTGASDVYALGLVLLEALTGRRAYPGGPTESALARLQAGPVIPASLGPGWVHLLDAMTATDAAERPGAAAVAAQLSALTGAVPTAAPPAPAGETTVDLVLPRAGAAAGPPTAVRRTPTRRRPPRHRTVAAVAAAAAAILALEMVWVEGGAESAPPAAASTHPRAARHTTAHPTPSETPSVEPAVTTPVPRKRVAHHAPADHARKTHHAKSPKPAAPHHKARKHHGHHGKAHGKAHGKGGKR